MPRRLDATDYYQRLLEFRTGLQRFLRWIGRQARAQGLTPAQHQLLLAILGHADPDVRLGFSLDLPGKDVLPGSPGPSSSRSGWFALRECFD